MNFSFNFVLIGDIEKIYSLSQKNLGGYSQSKPMSSALSRYKDHLMYYYKDTPILRDDKLSIAPCGQFISLALIKKGESMNRFSRETFHGGIDQIKASKYPIKIEQILKPSSKFVLVEGPPGIGKSTLCWELCRRWDGLKVLQNYDVVLLLKLRERRVQKATSLEELFYHDNKRLSKKVVSEVNKHEGKGILLILDGFDELPKPVVCDESNLIMRLIGSKSLPLATCLVTSRPSALHRTKYFPQVYRHIEILGFTDEHKREFAEAAFKSEPEIQRHFMNFVISNPVINSLMYIPVNCAIIAQVYKDIKGRNLLPKTMTQLYTTLILVLIRRYMMETKRWDEDSRVPRSVSELPSDILEDLDRISELAHRGLFRDNVQLVFFEDDILNSFQYLGLLIESKEMYVSEGAKTSYSFLHLSIQEFLAAWYVFSHPGLVEEAIAQTFDKPKHMFSQVAVKAHLSTFGRFLAGMIGCSMFPINFGKLREGYATNINYIVNCFYESQDPIYLNSLPIDVFWGIILSTPLDMYIFGYTLVHAPIWWEISFHFSVEILLRSITDNLHPQGKMVGYIKGLQINSGETKYFLSHLEELPLKSLASISLFNIDCFCVPDFCELISSCTYIKEVSLTIDEGCEDDHMLLELLKCLNLNEFNITFRELTCDGIQNIVEFVSNSSSLESVNISTHLRDSDDYFSYEEWGYEDLIRAAVSSNFVETLATNIPYRCFDSARQVRKLSFSIPDNHLCVSSQSVHDSLSTIAAMCKMPTVECLTLGFKKQSMASSLLKDSIVILNNSVWHNSSLQLNFEEFECPFSLFVSFVLHLSKDPGILCKNLKRSRSLDNLATLGEKFDLKFNGTSKQTLATFDASLFQTLSIEERLTTDNETSFGEGSDGSSEGEVMENYSECQVAETDQDMESDGEYFSEFSEHKNGLQCRGHQSILLESKNSISCPNLSELQLVYSMHPVLYGQLTKCLVTKQSTLPSPYKSATLTND